MKLKIYHLLLIAFLIQSCNNEVATDYEGSESYTITPVSTESKSYTFTIESFVNEYNNEVEIFEIPDSLSFNSVNRIFQDEFIDNNLFILKNSILKNALFLTTDSNFNYYKEEGLAYVWGSKNSKLKIKPSKYRGNPNICSKELYGLDCSGFIYEILKDSKLDLPKKPRNYANAQWFSNTENWKKPLDKYFSCSDCYHVFKPKQKSIESLKSGDIIYFKINAFSKRAYHIGIVFKFNKELILFESMGNPKYGCESNIKKGPRKIKLTEKFLRGKHYEILRIIEN